MKKIMLFVSLLLIASMLAGCGLPIVEQTGDIYCSSCGKKVSSSSTYCPHCGSQLNNGSNSANANNSVPSYYNNSSTVTKSWSDWSTSYPPPYATEIESKDYIVGYNMVLYVTQRESGAHGRVFRSYSINGDYAGYNARKSYGEYHFTKYVTYDELNKARVYPEGSNIENNYKGYQAGNGNSYYFGNDDRDYTWFIESEVYGTFYRYR